MKLIHISKTDVGLVRPANEDSIGSIINNSGVYSNIYIVCDGMGGHVGGARASQTAIRSIEEYFKNTPDPTPNIALNDAIEFANMQIFGDAESNPEFKGMGTTVTLMVESEGLFYIAHVGDSRIYINTDKKLYRLTKDHSFVQSLVDAGELTDAEMETHPRKNELTRALGIAMEVDVEVAPQPIRAKSGDKFLLCSDGLCGLINDTMILTTINAYSELDATVDELIELAKKAGGHDNISADLIEVIESDFAKTKFVDKNNVPNTNTGTQEVVIETDKKKDKSNKKLVQMILSVAALIVIAGGSYMTFSSDEEKPKTDENEKVSDVDNEKELSFEEKLLEMDLFEKKSNNLSIIYSPLEGSKKGDKWDFKEFTDAIKSNNFNEINDENREKQQFFIAKDTAIISLAEARVDYKDGEKEFQKGDLIFIMLNDLNKIEKLPIVYDQTDKDIVANVISLIGNKRKKLNKNQKQGCTVSFDPKNQKQSTAEEQKYPVKVTVKKGTVTKVFTFEETIKADPKKVNKADEKTVKAILDLIKSRDISNIDTKGCTITFIPDKAPPATYEDKTHKFTVIVELGAEEARNELPETIKADQALKNNYAIAELKKNDWEDKYVWHNKGCLATYFEENKSVTPTLYRYDSEIIVLNKKYIKEINYQETEYKEYTLKTENCSDQIYLFSPKKQTKNREDKGFGNRFTDAEITILAECTEDNYPINLCPPNTTE